MPLRPCQVLKGLLPLFPHLRVILMSATLNTDAFSAYFDHCPVLQVPGFTHPVEDFFLEEVLELTGYTGTVQKELADLSARHAVGGGVKDEPKEGEEAAEAAEAAEEGPSAGHVDDVEAAIMAAFLDEEGTAVDTLVDTLSDQQYKAINIVHPTTGATPLMVSGRHWTRERPPVCRR